MALRYVTLAQVRATSGVPVKLLSDADLTSLCEQIEFTVERMVNTSFVPRTFIEQLEGDGSNRLVLKSNPVLKVRALKVDDTSVTPSTVRVDKQPGIIWLTSDSEITRFKSKSSERNLVRVKYDSGLLEDDYSTTGYQTTSSAAVVAGDSVQITVADSSGYSASDFVEISGFDSYQETVKINSVDDSTHITVDNLAYPHESGSLVTKQVTPKTAERMMVVACAMGSIANVVGSSFDEITSYQLGDEQVSKGEPFTQWREVTVQLQKEWTRIINSFRIRPAVF